MFIAVFNEKQLKKRIEQRNPKPGSTPLSASAPSDVLGMEQSQSLRGVSETKVGGLKDTFCLKVE